MKKIYTTLKDELYSDLEEMNKFYKQSTIAETMRFCFLQQFERMQKNRYGYKGSNQKVNKQELEIEARNKIKDMAENNPDGLTKHLYDIDYVKDEILDANPDIKIVFNIEKDDKGITVLMGKYTDIATGNITSKYSVYDIQGLINDLKKEGKLI